MAVVKKKVAKKKAAPKKTAKKKAAPKKKSPPKKTAKKVAKKKTAPKKVAKKKAAKKKAAPKKTAKKVAKKKTAKKVAKKKVAKKQAAPKKAAKRMPPKKKAAKKKTAKKVRVRPFPIAMTLHETLESAGALMLVKEGARGGRFCELVVQATKTTVREGKVGTKGKSTIKRIRAIVGRSWAVRQAKGLLADGYVLEGVEIPAPIMKRWLRQVDRIGRGHGWEIDSERIFT